MIYTFLLVRGIHLLKGFSLDLGVYTLCFFVDIDSTTGTLCFMFVLILSSIFGVWTLQKKSLSIQNKGHLGSRTVLAEAFFRRQNRREIVYGIVRLGKTMCQLPWFWLILLPCVTRGMQGSFQLEIAKKNACITCSIWLNLVN